MQAFHSASVIGVPSLPPCSPGRGAGVGDLDREIEAARLLYWRLLARKAQARGVDLYRVVTDEAQYIALDGNVFMGAEALTGRGRPAGRTTAHRPDWDAWGLEAAGPPWLPPPSNPPKRNPPKPPAADQPAPEPTPAKKPRRRKGSDHVPQAKEPRPTAKQLRAE